MIKGVIFDMDGLMIDSETVTYQCFVRKLEELGHDDFTAKDYQKVLGKNKQGICQVIIDKYGQDFPIEEFWDDTHIWLDESLRNHVPIKESLIELLEFLKEHHYKTAVASSSEKRRVTEILTNGKVYDYIDEFMCGDEVEHGKPHPEIFLKACEKIGVQPEEALVLEDSESGILASHRAHIKVICIPDRKYPEEEYASYTTKICPSLLDIIDYLKEDK